MAIAIKNDNNWLRGFRKKNFKNYKRPILNVSRKTDAAI